MDEREERVAQNEATSREINEKIEQAQTRSPDDYFRIVCECGRRDCSRVIAISVAEYESVRSDARYFAVVSTHVIADVEEVVRETDRFSVVRKHEGTPAQVAEDEDPRS
jgi:mannose-1-phosphate guanylyltransferase